MRIKLWVPMLLIGACIASANDQVLKVFSWKDAQAQNKLLTGTVEGDDLLLEQSGSLPFYARILVIESPPITGAHYALSGEISYERVEGKGYLEMWSYFPGGGAFFSRTLADSGPMGVLKGTSDRRTFQLSYQNEAGGPPPERLELSLVLPDQGRVRIGPLKLIQFQTVGAAEKPASWFVFSALIATAIVAIAAYILFRARQRRKMELRRMTSVIER